jgi:tetratricopeptide (TPR) repeat protein
LLKELINFSGKDYKKALYLAVYSAEIIKEFFELKIVDDRNAMRFFNIAKFLSESNFQGLLLDILKNYKGKAGRQIEVFNYAVTKGISIIKKLLKGERVKIERRGANDMNIFTESSLKTLSSKFFYKGLKEFYLSNYDKALMDFTESSRIYRDNPFNYWNIARIEKLRNNKKHSILNYQKAFSAFESSDISLKRKYTLIHPMANLIRM